MQKLPRMHEWKGRNILPVMCQMATNAEIATNARMGGC